MPAVRFFATKFYDNLLYDKSFLFAHRISLSDELSYFARKYAALITRSTEITYLGHKFHYDNPFAPVLLQGYPSEIETLAEAVDLGSLKSVLDVGVNIGQWAFTLKAMFPHLTVHSLEPNPESFRILRDNSRGVKDWKVYNFGLGDGGRHKFLYYVGHVTSEASVYKELQSGHDI